MAWARAGGSRRVKVGGIGELCWDGRGLARGGQSLAGLLQERFEYLGTLNIRAIRTTPCCYPLLQAAQARRPTCTCCPAPTRTGACTWTAQRRPGAPLRQRAQQAAGWRPSSVRASSPVVARCGARVKGCTCVGACAVGCACTACGPGCRPYAVPKHRIVVVSVSARSSGAVSAHSVPPCTLWPAACAVTALCCPAPR